MAMAMFNLEKEAWFQPDPDYVQVQAFMRTADFPKQFTNDVELRLEPCLENSYIERVPDDEKGFVKVGICLNEEDKLKTELHATPSNLQSTIFEIRVSKCQNRTSCKTASEFQKYVLEN